MSQALPMSPARRAEIYDRGMPVTLTPRQYRQFRRMEARWFSTRVTGRAATGIPTRRPIVRPSAPPERGSIRTHIAVRCDEGCSVHLKPRLHRFPRRGAA